MINNWSKSRLFFIILFSSFCLKLYIDRKHGSLPENLTNDWISLVPSRGFNLLARHFLFKSILLVSSSNATNKHDFYQQLKRFQPMEESDAKISQEWKRMMELYRIYFMMQTKQKSDNDDEKQRLYRKAEFKFVEFFSNTKIAEWMKHLKLDEEKRNSVRSDPEFQLIMKNFEEKEFVVEKLNKLLQVAFHSADNGQRNSINATSIVQPIDGKVLHHGVWTLEELLWIVKEKMQNPVENLPHFDAKDILLIFDCEQNKSSEFYEDDVDAVHYETGVLPEPVNPQRNDNHHFVTPGPNMNKYGNTVSDSEMKEFESEEEIRIAMADIDNGLDVNTSDILQHHLSKELSEMENFFVSDLLEYVFEMQQNQVRRKNYSCNVWTELFVLGIRQIHAQNKTDLLMTVFKHSFQTVVKKWTSTSLTILRRDFRLIEKSHVYPSQKAFDDDEAKSRIRSYYRNDLFPKEGEGGDFDIITEHNTEAYFYTNTSKRGTNSSERNNFEATVHRRSQESDLHRDAFGEDSTDRNKQNHHVITSSSENSTAMPNISSDNYLDLRRFEHSRYSSRYENDQVLNNHGGHFFADSKHYDLLQFKNLSDFNTLQQFLDRIERELLESIRTLHVRDLLRRAFALKQHELIAESDGAYSTRRGQRIAQEVRQNSSRGFGGLDLAYHSNASLIMTRQNGSRNFFDFRKNGRSDDEETLSSPFYPDKSFHNESRLVGSENNYPSIGNKSDDITDHHTLSKNMSKKSDFNLLKFVRLLSQDFDVRAANISLKKNFHKVTQNNSSYGNYFFGNESSGNKSQFKGSVAGYLTCFANFV